MKYSTRMISADERFAYLKDHPSPEDKAACNEAIAEAMHELNKIKRRIKITVVQLLKTEYAKARAEGRKPSVGIEALVMRAAAAVTTADGKAATH